jgi:dihydroorotate dehydrogenase electron transfer subunit
MSHVSQAYYADRAWQGTVAVVENVRLARDTYRLCLACPELARRIVPGQFVMLRLAGFDDPLLGRPLALYDTWFAADGNRASPTGIDVVYLVLGKLTSRLARYQPGQRIDIWGPLGNGFPPRASDHLVMVAGGIGQTPFLALAREYLGLRTYGDPPRAVPPARRVTLCYGARSADLLAGVEDFRAAGVDARISTDDGTAGRHGLVTDVLTQVLDEARVLDESAATAIKTRVVCCGPEPMMAAVAALTESRGVDCQVSLETPMACGIGICFSCVARVRDEAGGWDYRRTCVEGPVFDAGRIAFH